MDRPRLAPAHEEGQPLDPSFPIRILLIDLSTLRPKTTIALCALSLVLLPTHLPRWLDTVSPLAREPFTVVRGTIARNSTLAAALSRDALSRHGPPPRRGGAPGLRPGAALRRPSVRPGSRRGRPAQGLHLRDRRAAHPARHPPRRGARGRGRDALLRDPGGRRVRASITSSLFGAVTAAGEDDQLAIDLADIFAWDVDFNTRDPEGRLVPRGGREAARSTAASAATGASSPRSSSAGTRVLQAVRFDGLAASGYYAPDGHAAAEGLPALAPEVLADQLRASPPPGSTRS